MLLQITVKRFKGILEMALPLERINLLVGANNSGKSSILQAAQFAVSGAQTLRVLKAPWRKDQITAAFSASQLIYTPSLNIGALAWHGHFYEGSQYAIRVEFEHTGVVVPEQNGTEPTVGPNLKSAVAISKGRGQHIRCTILGAELGRQLEGIRSPFSVFVPGLAGIPTFEELKSAATVRRAAARGDANNVLRNVLWLLKQEPVQWLQFQTDFQRVFPKRSVEVTFNTDLDEHITATVTGPSGSLPIDAAGTGVLQAIQILAYINLSKPRLLILDEPDAHLHPNNQRRLAELLLDLSESRKFQVLLSTHSRHLVDALRSKSRMHWIRDGKRIEDGNYDEVSVLLEIGALDRGDRLKAGKIKCVVLSEDEDTSIIEALLTSAGWNKAESEIWAYKGCTKLETATALIGFITQHAPATKILVHRDRDYMTTQEVTGFESAVKSAHPNANVFLTPGTDAEASFLVPEHIRYLAPSLSLPQATQLIEQATNETKEESLKAFINSRTPIEAARLRKENKQVNHGELALECSKLYDADTKRYRHGKRTVKKLRSLLHATHNVNPNPYSDSTHIIDTGLKAIFSSIWPPAAAANPSK